MDTATMILTVLLWVAVAVVLLIGPVVVCQLVRQVKRRRKKPPAKHERLELRDPFIRRPNGAAR